ncbi:MAG: ABC transporter ATP-binding protein [Candidatus Eremiobacteraeota bacterium]|nr:ABC transporter ATP-binding protein [Candidatus Eremiobacteraeota bacterium]MBV8339895.1 ABC transporter ATP-binding protein [Candidatus Eremiobacteraeota bacterium]MBV8594694.1 ABC transporter ATP-binding protein [Candidatus Eremiobacteraeota bacterium]MBV8670033.1 ABC transporter ATP-binding protein [Candidatus Eremiobacteraeota bacterium]
MSAPILSLSGVEAYYGRIQALRGLSLDVGEGEIVALIGANGAGKTTTLRTISGLLAPARGSINLFGESIVGMRADQIVRKGIVQSPEGRRIFPRLTVLENLRLGAYARTDRAIAGDFDRVLSLFPRLGERLKQKGGTLSGGEQQMLAIGRALMAGPKVLLLDEPSLGLSPILVDTIFNVIADVNRSGVPILLIEQNARKALQVAARGYVLETGTIVKSGPAATLLADDDVRKAYLGED